MLKVDNLTVTDGRLTIVNNLSFRLKRGELLAVVGPNDSGKSLLLQTLAGFTLPTQGDIRLNHFSLRENAERAKLHLGYLANPVIFEPYLTGFEFLELIGSFYHLSPTARLERILHTSQEFGCRDYLYTPLERVSRGYQQRLMLIASLIHQPATVIWDEPTVHLDPLGVRQTETVLSCHLKEGGSAIIASNNLEWLQAVADYYLIMTSNGEVFLGTATELKHQFRLEDRNLETLYFHLNPIID